MSILRLHFDDPELVFPPFHSSSPSISTNFHFPQAVFFFLSDIDHGPGQVLELESSSLGGLIRPVLWLPNMLSGSHEVHHSFYWWQSVAFIF